MPSANCLQIFSLMAVFYSYYFLGVVEAGGPSRRTARRIDIRGVLNNDSAKSQHDGKSAVWKVCIDFSSLPSESALQRAHKAIKAAQGIQMPQSHT